MGFGDCVFWSIIALVTVTFMWLKFIEPYLSIWFSLPVSGVIVLFIFVYGGGFGRNRRRKETNGRCGA